jgi:hypothetical protein
MDQSDSAQLSEELPTSDSTKVLSDLSAEATYYDIVVRSSSKESAVSGASQDNVPIVQYDRNNGFNQQWSVYYVDDYVAFRARHSGKFMDVFEGRTESDVQIIQHPHKPVDNQLWKLFDLGNNEYAIQAKHSGLFMTIQGNSQDNDALFIQYPWEGKNNQKFEFYTTNITALSGTSAKFPDTVVLHSIDSLPKIY